MGDIIYQASDLASSKRVDFLRDAKSGGARLRDKDGLSLVALPESSLLALRNFAYWSQRHLLLSKRLETSKELSVADLGDLAWLRVFDLDDIKEFCDELHNVLMASMADDDAQLLQETVAAWKLTAKQLEDPLRRSVLMSSHSPSDYVEASFPSSADDE